MPDTHDAAAYAHYADLIAAWYPPHLAAALAASRYAHGLTMAELPMSLPALQAVLKTVSNEHPELGRDAARVVAAIDRKMRRVS